jgi:OmcA/MtrC family decaheme c-type cytochrome
MDSQGKLKRIRSGEYTYTFKTALPPNYDRKATHAVGGLASRDGGRDVANDVYYFVPGGGQLRLTRQLVATENCNQCHDPKTAHDGLHRDVRLCVLCHTPQNVDPETGNSADFKVMVHRIHMGLLLPSVKGGKPYFMIGTNQKTSDFSKTKWPRDIRNCTTCHQKAPQAENYKLKPSTAACTSCHENVDPIKGINHLGGPQSDSTCALCHVPDGKEFDASIVGAHTIPAASSQLAGLKAEIVSVSNISPGQRPVVVFNLKDNRDKPVNPTDLDTLEAAIAHPTTDYAQRFTEVIRRKPSGGRPGSETPSKAVDLGGGNFSYTFTMTIDLNWKGSLALGLEGSRRVKIKGREGKEVEVVEAFFNPVAHASITGPMPVARRHVVLQENCNECHLDLGSPVGVSVHNGVRKNVQYCVMCHNASLTDEEKRTRAKGPMPPESVHFKLLMHKLHTGKDLGEPFVVYGGSPARPGPINLGEIRYPGDRRNCGQCHTKGTEELLLSEGLLATSVPQPGGGVASISPIAAACTGCHTRPSARAHVETQIAAGGKESCEVCHGPNREFSVAKEHQR